MPEVPLGHNRLGTEVWRHLFALLPMRWRALCCRVCKAWKGDLELPQQGGDILVDYGVATLCSVLAEEGADEVMRRMHLSHPGGIPSDMERMDQVRRFVERHADRRIESVDEWMQLASQEPETGWLCKGVSKMVLEGAGKGLMTQVVGKPRGFGQLMDTLTGHSSYVLSVAFSPDNRTVASASGDSTVKLWDLSGDTPVEKVTLRGHSSRCVAFSPDSKTLATGSGTIKLWDLSGEMPVEKGTLRGHNGNVESLAWNHDGSLLASTGDQEIRLWTPNGKEKGNLRGHKESIYCIAWNHDGSLLASASGDKTVKLWDPKTTEEQGTLTGHSHENPDCTCEFLVGLEGEILGVHFFFLDEDCPVVDPRLKGTLTGHIRDNPECTCRHYKNEREPWKVDVNAECPVRGHSEDVKYVAFNHDGSLLATASDDKTVKLWDPTTMEAKGILRGNVASWQGLDPETKELGAKVKPGGSAGSNRTGQYIVTANGNMVYVYKINLDGKEQEEPLACFCSNARVKTVSCRGTKVVVGCADGQVLFLEAPLLAVG